MYIIVQIFQLYTQQFFLLHFAGNEQMGPLCHIYKENPLFEGVFLFPVPFIIYFTLKIKKKNFKNFSFTNILNYTQIRTFVYQTYVCILFVNKIYLSSTSICTKYAVSFIKYKYGSIFKIKFL